MIWSFHEELGVYDRELRVRVLHCGFDARFGGIATRWGNEAALVRERIHVRLT